MQASFAQLPLQLRRHALWIIVLVVLLHGSVLWLLTQWVVTQPLPVKKDKVVTVRIIEPVVSPQPPVPQSSPQKAEVVPEKKVVTAPVPIVTPKVLATTQKPAKPTREVIVPNVVESKAPAKSVKEPTPTVTTNMNSNNNNEPKPVTNVQTNTAQGPKKVQIGGNGVQWSRTPNLSYTNRDLAGQNRKVSVLIEADEKGVIRSVQLLVSSGLSILDEKVMRSVRNARFKPYKENGQALAIRAEQPFELSLTP